MNATKGYYSLIQFCPYPSRAEAVNLGVLLFCPERDFLRAKVAESNARAAKLVGRSNLKTNALKAAKRSLIRRFEVDRSSFATLEDLQKFVDSRGNDLKLTSPRPMKVFDPASDLENLFTELVGGLPQSKDQSKPLLPRVDEFFQRLHQAGKAKLNYDVTLPVVNQTRTIPYMYLNEVTNLVLPQRFPSQEVAAVDTALKLGGEGELLQKFPSESEERRKLIVLPSFSPKTMKSGLHLRVAKLLAQFEVKSVAGDEIESFLAEVEEHAHA